jgi:chromosome segregation ATPase
MIDYKLLGIVEDKLKNDEYIQVINDIFILKLEYGTIKLEPYNESNVVRLEETIEELEHTIMLLEDDIDELNEEVKDLNREITALEDELEGVE